MEDNKPTFRDLKVDSVRVLIPPNKKLLDSFIAKEIGIPESLGPVTVENEILRRLDPDTPGDGEIYCNNLLNLAQSQSLSSDSTPTLEGPLDGPPVERWLVDEDEEEKAPEKKENRFISLSVMEKVLHLKRSQLKKLLNLSGAIIVDAPDPKSPTTMYRAIDRMDALYFAEYLLENQDTLKLKHKTVEVLKAIAHNSSQLTK